MHARTWFFFAFACLSGCAAQTEVIIDPAPPPPDADEPEIVILGYDAATPHRPPGDPRPTGHRRWRFAGGCPRDGHREPAAARLTAVSGVRGQHVVLTPAACASTTAATAVEFCGTACGGGCPAGYACAALMAGTGTVQQCVPTSGRCAGLPTPTDAGTSSNPYLCAACTSAAQCGAGGLCLRDARTLNIFCGTPAPGAPRTSRARHGSPPRAGRRSCARRPLGTCPGAPPPIDAGTPDIPAPDVASPPPVDAGPVTLTVGTNTVAIGSRQAILYVPSARIQAGIVLLHGNGDTAMNFLLTSGFREVASAQNVALIVPLAISGSGPMGVDWTRTPDLPCRTWT